MYPTTTIRILTTMATTDIFGDVVDNSTVVASGIPASILERRLQVTLPSTMEPRTIRYYTGRVNSGTAITENNRIQDERTNDIYVVESVAQLATPAWVQDLRLDLRKVAGDPIPTP